MLALDDVRAATGLVVRPVVVARDELNKAIDRFQRADNDLDDVAASLAVDNIPGLTSLTSVGEDAPIVRYVNTLIEQAIENRASDLHLEPTEGDMRVRYRIDGVLHEVDTVPRAVQSALISRLKIMSNVDITERRVPQNGRITVELGSRSVDLRVATLPTVWGEKIVLRVLDTGGIDLDLKNLGFSENNYARFSESFTKPHGMLLVTGPTGSGKSTTLYATLTEISKPEVNIITVEDPVEYRLPGVNQVQVNHKAGLTFAAVLPAILRSDPDIVLIGEIRDRVTAQLAVEAALTGHLVLSTLHTNDAPSAVTRLVEMGIEPFLVGQLAGLRDGAAAGPPAVPVVQGALRAHPLRTDRGALALRVDRGAERAVAPGGLPVLLEHRLPRPPRAARGHAGHRGDRTAHRVALVSARRAARRHRRRHGHAACRRHAQGRRRRDFAGWKCCASPSELGQFSASVGRLTIEPRPSLPAGHPGNADLQVWVRAANRATRTSRAICAKFVITARCASR